MKEIRGWTVAIGNAPGPFAPLKIKRSAKKALKYISELEGLIGFHSVYPMGTLCIFATENDAKRAKNLMDAKGIKTGNNICECFAPAEDVPEKLLPMCEVIENDPVE